MVGALIAVGMGLVADGQFSEPDAKPTPLPGPGGIPSGSPETISTGGGPQRIQ